MPEPQTQHRTIVVGLVWNRRGELLFCKMHPQRGVFPGQWGFPGGGIEPGERMEAALRRELREELGIEIDDVRPAFFKDGCYEKSLPDGSKKSVYMIFLLFHCTAREEELRLNDEFTEHRWVAEEGWHFLDLNTETIDTLRRLGWGGTRSVRPLAGVGDLGDRQGTEEGEEGSPSP